MPPRSVKRRGVNLLICKHNLKEPQYGRQCALYPFAILYKLNMPVCLGGLMVSLTHYQASDVNRKKQIIRRWTWSWSSGGSWGRRSRVHWYTLTWKLCLHCTSNHASTCSALSLGYHGREIFSVTPQSVLCWARCILEGCDEVRASRPKISYSSVFT